MRVLVTGNRGKVGVAVVEHLAFCQHQVVGFDLVDGDDLLDLAAVKSASSGCDAIVHLGGLANDRAGSSEAVMEVNVSGTEHVLLAAEAASVNRVVHCSSVQVLGIGEGEQQPDYFPVDDEHPRRATRPYGTSKSLAEDLCQSFSERTGTLTISLRPVAVWPPGYCRDVERRWLRRPRSEWEPYWEYGAFVDVRDVASAIGAALSQPLEGHHRALLCAEDIAARAPALQLSRRLAPAVPVRDPARYAGDPWSSLVDCSVARAVLGWRPRYRWSDRDRLSWRDEWHARVHRARLALDGRGRGT